MKKTFLIFVALISISILKINAQLDVKYQLPPEEILELADVDLPPSFYVNDEGDKAIMLYRNQYKSIEELAQKEMRLGGLRINPKTNISSRARYYYKLSVYDIKEKKEKEVSGLSKKMKITNFSFSPDQKYIAFTNTTDKGVELWILDVEASEAKKLTEDNLNANLGRPFVWFPNSSALLVKYLPEDKKDLIDTENAIPTGPIVSVNTGQKAQNRTYQDLLKNNNDEFNFEQLVLSDIYKVTLEGKVSKWKETAMYRGMDFSPDGNYILVTTIEKPFSYIVPYYRFPSKTNIYDQDGKLVKEILETPLLEVMPKGFMSTQKGMRSLSWRSDKPATLYWVEALDEGDPAVEVEYRDEVFELDAPFDGEKKSLMKTINRFSGIAWSTDELAVAYDYWWNTRNTKTYLFNPSDNTQKPEVIWDRNYQDRYSNPGSFVMKKNEFGMYTIKKDKNKLYLTGDGYSKEGKKPFFDEFDINTKETKRIWQAENKNKLEDIVDVIDVKKGILLTRIESPTEYPNYYLRNIKKDSKEQITFIENPFKSLAGIHKEVIKYKRDDGLELSATLYLPADYDMEKKEKLPMVMWAYPREYKDKKSAAQVTSSSNEFTYPYYGSPIYWVTRGYAILDDAAFPIVGEGDEEPNDSFIEQLVADGKAAIDAVDALGYIDRNKVAVGGHSYGAFMTANLLSHSDHYAAGIARSGAYNRTLTPFGFQSEERTYWEAPEIYYEMSPFMHADEMKTPLLLIHGDADNNSGTYTMQSKRYFNALKGLGATVRLVLLPLESHGYSARESVLHLLWEQDQWLEKYVKNREVENK